MKKHNHCIDCGKSIFQAKRCRSCASKELWRHPEFRKRMRQGQFRGGRKKGKCIDCGKNITFGYKRCHNCAGKEARKKYPITEETKNRLSQNRGGKNNPNWKGGRWKIKDAFESSIRRQQIYLDWRNSILKRDVSTYPEIPQKLQVHHLKSFKKILEDNCIKTREEANVCQELWDTNNGVTLTTGEHYIITLLNRHKKVSRGFLTYLKYFVEQHKDNLYPWCGENAQDLIDEYREQQNKRKKKK